MYLTEPKENYEKPEKDKNSAIIRASAKKNLCTFSWEAGINLTNLPPVVLFSCLHYKFQDSFSMHLMVPLGSNV